MKYLLTLLVLLILSSTSYATDVWTKKDTTYQAICLTLKAVDWLQTKEIARNPNYYELNPILGKYPSQNEVDLYFASTAIAHTIIAYYLPKKYRRIWQCVFIGIQAGCVGHNINAGINIHF